MKPPLPGHYSKIMKCFQIKISGEIQGEGLRFKAMYHAHKHNIKGFVKYSKPSEIFIEAEGEEKSIEQFIECFRDGSLSAQVTGINIKESVVKSYQSFEILHTIAVNSGTSIKPITQNCLKAFLKKHLQGSKFNFHLK
jgi:acylphosphatase